MQKDLVMKLSEFGFTTNQAKVYLSIIESGVISVGKISQNTQLYVQDIYKILPKLEKMGLITKTIDKPVMIKAIPVEKALSRLVDTEKEKAEKRIDNLENNLKELTDSIRYQQFSEIQSEESCFIPLMTVKQIKNRADLTFGNATSSCDLVINLDLIQPLMGTFHHNFKQFSKNNANVRIIIEDPSEPDYVKKIIEKAFSEYANISVKLVYKLQSIPYYIIDRGEVWISMEKKTEIGLPCVLWTNGKNIVQFFQECFNEAWKKPNAIKIYPTLDALTSAPNTMAL